MSEILGALFKYLVALLGASAVVAVFYLTLAQSKAQEAISDLVQLQTNTQQLFAGQTTFTGLTTAVAITAGLAPSKMVTGTGVNAALANPWGGAVTITANATNNTTFDISSTLVPQDACAKMAMTMGAPGSGVTGGTITGTAATNFNAPLNVATVGAACSAAANTVLLTFGH